METTGKSNSLKVLAQEPLPERPRAPRQSSVNTLNRNLLLFSRWAANITVLGLGDCLVLTLSFYAGGLLRASLKGSAMLPEWWGFLIGVWLVASCGIRLLPGWGLGPVEELRRTVLLWVGLFAATTSVLFFGKLSADVSRLTLTLGFILSLPLLPLMRLWMKRLLIRTGLWGMQSVIYTDIATAPVILEALRAESGLGYIPVAIFDEQADSAAGSVGGVPVLPEEELAGLFAPVAILAIPGLSRHHMLELLEGPLSIYRHVVMVPDLVEAPTLWVKPRDLGGILGLEISSNLLDGWTRFIKRATDMMMVLTLLPLWSTVMLLLAALILLCDRHNPFFVQTRVGQGGHLFRMWKFRTMRKDAELYLQQKLAENQELRKEWDQHFKLRKDPRITAMGRFLRRTSLDEIPQFINVLNGQMSLVGPRPLPVYHEEELPARAKALRSRVRPGITGLWQVSGRSEAGNQGLVRWDSYYVRNWSVWLDIVILVRTFRAVLHGRGAY